MTTCLTVSVCVMVRVVHCWPVQKSFPVLVALDGVLRVLSLVVVDAIMLVAMWAIKYQAAVQPYRILCAEVPVTS